MLLDFKKLFPLSSSQQGLDNFSINTDEVTTVRRIYKRRAGAYGESVLEDFIQIGEAIYRLPALDDGVIILNAIIQAQKFLENLSTVDEGHGNISSQLSDEKQIVQNYLVECSEKYGYQFKNS